MSPGSRDSNEVRLSGGDEHWRVSSPHQTLICLDLLTTEYLRNNTIKYDNVFAKNVFFKRVPSMSPNDNVSKDFMTPFISLKYLM